MTEIAVSINRSAMFHRRRYYRDASESVSASRIPRGIFAKLDGVGIVEGETFVAGSALT